MLEADLTIVGTDQLFNEMMGRFYQERFGQPPQVIITSVLTPGIDGKEKQSKSLGNYIGLGHTAREKYGRLMSMPDNLVPLYFKVYTDIPLPEIAALEKEHAGNPMQLKTLLAQAIVARYHGKKAGEEEVEWFKKTFSNREFPATAPVVALGKSEASAYDIVRACFAPAEKSNSEIRRLFAQNAISVDGNTVEDSAAALTIPAAGAKVKVGKKNWFLVKK
jgi:tyrosyl-tRNA synthetase